MISDEDRARVGDVAMRAIDKIIDLYGEDAELEDVVLVYEVSYPDEGDSRLTEIGAETTTHRATVAGGMAAAYARTQIEGYCDDRDLDGG